MHLIFRLSILLYFPLFGIGTQFLSLPISADELAMGSHPACEKYFSVNPAVYTVPDNRPEFFFGRGSWFGDVNTANLAFHQKIKGAMLHLKLKYTGLSNIELRDNRPSDEAMAYFSSFGISSNAGFSVESNKSRFGLSMQAIRMDIYTESSQGLALNIGYLYKISKRFSIATSMLNIGKMSSLQDNSPKLPLRIFLGLGNSFFFNKYRNKIYLSAEWNQFSNSAQFWGGNVFSWNKFRIMGGGSITKKAYTISAGIGIQLDNYNFSYAIRYGSQDIGIPQSISLGFLFP